ncbi:MAG TPA: IS66 family insertion sequence element accessory protein TnpB, partial [Terriglobales bacterium]|nr:IS66 family insertion sequence element accessory protein TnpB [Terriglobales bacterium]
KVLWYDRNGYCLLYKRFHRACFELPVPNAAGGCVCIDAAALARMIAGIDSAPRNAARRSKNTRNDAHRHLSLVASPSSSLANSDA